jgi:high affinity Mn2+ porin
MLAALLLAVSPLALAEGAADGTAAAPERFAVHGQFTYVEQETDSFNAPYRGSNSLSPSSGRETIDATLFVGARLWDGAEGWLNGDIDQGFGLDNTLGVAGFPSGAAYKVGKNDPYLRLTRAFVRQNWDLGEPTETVDAAANQLGGIRSANRLVLTVGKFSVPDVFDQSAYAHDPRADFLNWGAVDAATFDYAADAWGYTLGAALEWYQGRWTARAAFLDLSDIPNSTHLDPGAHEFQLIAELERRHEIAGHGGRLLVTAFLSRGRMGLLDAAVEYGAAHDTPAAVAPVRQYRSRDGIDISVEQSLSDELGVFARAGGAAGNVEAYEFTDVDRSYAAGLSLKGSRWGRARDTVGLIAMTNLISAARRAYLADGGLGILVGDGELPHEGPERIVEAYYELATFSFAQLTLDYQRVENPGYNPDRGPVSIFAVRVHAQF